MSAPDRAPRLCSALLLVLAADVSYSIRADEYELQRAGYASALTDPQVLAAIQANPHGRIGICYVEWSGDAAQKVVVDWMIVDGIETARKFAAGVAESPRSFSERTAIGAAIDFSIKQIARAPFASSTRVIDISGDGDSNAGRDAANARDEAISQGITINENVPSPDTATSADDKAGIIEALAYMKLPAGAPIKGTKINVAFLASCTNGRLSDFQEVAKYIKGRKVAAGVKAIAVPGSQIVAAQCEKPGLDKILSEAGFEWRAAGCSMCLAMNPDKLIGDQLCASSSNRNFKGRQGSPTGRTLLMSPVMVAAAAIAGEVTDARELFGIEREGA